MSNLPGPDLSNLQPGDEVSSEIIAHTEAGNERSLARRIALQALYEIDSTGHDVGVVINAQINNRDQPLPRKTVNYLRRLVLGVTRYHQNLDRTIRKFASEWPLEQVAIVDRNILRIAIFEFALSAAIPTGVAIDEAIELAKVYGADGSSRFVNGVLGTLANDEKTIAQLESEYLENGTEIE